MRRHASRPPPRTGSSTASSPPTILLGSRFKLRLVAGRRQAPYPTASSATAAPTEFPFKIMDLHRVPRLRSPSTTPAAPATPEVASWRLLRLPRSLAGPL